MHNEVVQGERMGAAAQRGGRSGAAGGLEGPGVPRLTLMNHTLTTLRVKRTTGPRCCGDGLIITTPLKQWMWFGSLCVSVERC